MKALCVSGMPNPTPPTPPGTLSRRDEAHALAKRALTLRMSSHVCWHVYGLLYRADRNYAEAIKCYKRALKLEPSLNAGEGQILRDLSHLQIQERDVEGFVESRSALLAARPGQRYNWLPLAVGHHLTGVMMMGGGRGSGAGSSPSPSPASPSSSRPPSAAAAAADPSASTSTSGSNAESFLLAVSILDQYDSMASAEERDLPKRGTPEEFERSEIALYGAEVALEGGDAAGALARVEACLLALEDPREAKKLPWPPISPQSSAAAADAVAKPNVGAAPPARDLRYGVFDFFALFRVSSFSFAGAARELSERASPKGKTRKGKKSPLPRSPPPPPPPPPPTTTQTHLTGAPASSEPAASRPWARRAPRTPSAPGGSSSTATPTTPGATTACAGPWGSRSSGGDPSLPNRLPPCARCTTSSGRTTRGRRWSRRRSSTSRRASASSRPPTPSPAGSSPGALLLFSLIWSLSTPTRPRRRPSARSLKDTKRRWTRRANSRRRSGRRKRRQQQQQTATTSKSRHSLLPTLPLPLPRPRRPRS